MTMMTAMEAHREMNALQVKIKIASASPERNQPYIDGLVDTFGIYYDIWHNAATQEGNMKGLTVKVIRKMTSKELDAEYWPTDSDVPCIELSNGLVLYPSRDEEGNGPGCIFGRNEDGSTFMLG